MLNILKILLQYILPKLLLTRLIGWGANKKAGWITKLIINLFVKYYQVNMEEAKKSDIASYPTFNDFFVRSLKDGVRPLNTDPNVLVMPADGIITQLGKIEKNNILQAKGSNYKLESLLANHYLIANQFLNGKFVTIYLSPKDYHRVHMPCTGILREVIYVPGNLLSVNLLAAKNIPNLFTRNERVICLFETKFGPVAQILVGATIVGSIQTVWAGTITPPHKGTIKRWSWSVNDNKKPVILLKGQEMGRFKLGSTVINLFASGKVNFLKKIKSLSITKIGQPLATSNETIIFPIDSQ